MNKRCRSGGRRVQERRAHVAPPRTYFLAFKRLSMAVESAGEHAAAHRPHTPIPPRRARLLGLARRLSHVCVRVRDAGVDARAGIPTVEMPEDAVRHIASFFDGKTARKCASVCRTLAERAATHEDLAPPPEAFTTYLEKYVVKDAAITEEEERRRMHEELFGDYDSEDDDDDIPALVSDSEDDIPALVEPQPAAAQPLAQRIAFPQPAAQPPGRSHVHVHALVWPGVCAHCARPRRSIASWRWVCAC